MRRVIVLTLFGVLAGCASPADREAARQVWEERDMQRARECLATGGTWAAGTCMYGRP
jgi:hypothetical protein